MFSASRAGSSHAAAMLMTPAASRLPTAEWSLAWPFKAPSSGNSRIAACGETMRAACATACVHNSGVNARRYSDFQ